MFSFIFILSKGGTLKYKIAALRNKKAVGLLTQLLFLCRCLSFFCRFTGITSSFKQRLKCYCKMIFLPISFLCMRLWTNRSSILEKIERTYHFLVSPVLITPPPSLEHGCEHNNCVKSENIQIVSLKADKWINVQYLFIRRNPVYRCHKSSVAITLQER